MLFVGNLGSFQLYGTQNPLCVFFCCCYPVFTFFEEKLLLHQNCFLHQLTDVSSISLKRTFLLFRCHITLFSAFLHCMEILVFSQVITTIVILYNCKECFCGFAAKLRCCQVFLQQKRPWPVGGFITLIVAVSHSNERFSCFSPKLQCLHLFSHCKRFSALRS